MKLMVSLATLIASIAVASAAQNYIAVMDGAQDGGAGRTGSGTVNLSLSGNILTLNGSYSGLSGNSTASHIHGPAAPGVSAGVLYDLSGTTTFGAKSGTFNGSVTLADKTGYTLAQQMADLNSSMWYVNVHSTTFPGGEIRGQIVPVPEPSTLALFGLGATGLVVLLRRRAS